MVPLGSSLLDHYEIWPVIATYLESYINPLPVKSYPASDTKYNNGRKRAYFTVMETKGNFLLVHGSKETILHDVILTSG